MERREFTDSTIPSFFIAANRPITVLPKKVPESKLVVFIAEAEEGVIDKALEDLYANYRVPALDLIKALKTLRSMIYALKGGKEAIS